MLVATIRQMGAPRGTAWSNLPPPPPLAPTTGPMPGPVAGARVANSGEWRPASLGTALLWVGVVLLALASLIFAIVAWPSLGDAARLAVLVAATAGVGGAWFGLRRRLPVTSEAISALFVVMLLINWWIAWVAFDDGHVDGIVWWGRWSIGLILIGVAGAAMGAATDQKTPRVVSGLLVSLSGGVGVAWVAHSERAAAFGLTAVVTVLTVVAITAARQAGWKGFAASVASVAAVMWIVALGFAAWATSVRTIGEATISALVTLSLAAPLLIIRIGSVKDRAERNADAALGYLVALLGIWAVMDVLAVGLSDDGFVVAGAGVGLLVMVVTRFVPGRALAGWWAGGLTAAGIASVPAALVPMELAGRLVEALEVGAAMTGDLSSSVRALLAVGRFNYPGYEYRNYDPMVSLGETRMALAVLAIVVLAVAFEAIDLPGFQRRFGTVLSSLSGCAALAGIVVLVPFSVPTSVLAGVIVVMAAVVAIGGVCAALERDPRVPGAVTISAYVLLGIVWVFGWLLGLVDAWTTVATLGVGSSVAIVVSLSARPDSARSAFAAVATVMTVTLAGVVTSAVGAGPGVVGFVVVVAACVVANAVTRVSSVEMVRVPTEAIALCAMVFGVAYAADGELSWGALSLAATVPSFLVAGMAPSRSGYRWVAAPCSVMAWWVFLATIEADWAGVVEVYTVPAAAVALGVGWLARRGRPGGHDPACNSWLLFGPGLFLGFAPTLTLLVVEPAQVRGPATLVAAIAVALVGVWRRLQAPVVVGFVTLVILAIDTLWPVAAQVERWVLIAVAGVIFIWLGATFESRWRELRRASRLLGRLD